MVKAWTPRVVNWGIFRDCVKAMTEEKNGQEELKLNSNLGKW